MTDYDEIMAMASSVKMKCLELNHKAEVLELAANTIKELDFRETFNNKRSPVRILLIDSTEPNNLGQDINELFTDDELRTLVRKKAEDVIEKCKRDINPDPVPEGQQPEPEEAAGNKEAAKTADDEKNEVAPVQQPQAPEDHGEKNTLSDEELKNMYFKQGMAVKAISEETGLGPSGLYKRLEKMKKSIGDNAKEYARQIR